ncbi:DUF3024 domain-containing protein [Novosphingobium sp. Rr 2-17]|uniref:DUF3024 domain-containing protein n=1 Tax=Novosphingobium sp. Rr 2-17 TaxID=555793 RepID=UPI003FD1F858
MSPGRCLFAQKPYPSRWLPHIGRSFAICLLEVGYAAGRYRFMQRYRLGMAPNRSDEFDAPFARIDRLGPDNFDVQWMRHTGQWWRVYSGVSLGRGASSGGNERSSRSTMTGLPNRTRS